MEMSRALYGRTRSDRSGVQTGLHRPAPEPHTMGLREREQTTRKLDTGRNTEMTQLKYRKTQVII